MSKNEKTSKKVASLAAKLLRDPKTSKIVKSIAASVLTQAPDKKKKKTVAQDLKIVKKLVKII
jgi:uracil-DNA glycosylase